MNKVFFGDCRQSLRQMAADGIKVKTCVTSPPYFGLRSYGGGEAEIGTEKTPEQFIANLVDVFRGVYDILDDDGTLWVVIGDAYAARRGKQPPPTNTRNKSGHAVGGASLTGNLKSKDLMGTPWALAKALRDPFYTGRLKNEMDRIWLAAMVDCKGVFSASIRAGVKMSLKNNCTITADRIAMLLPASQGQSSAEQLGHLCAELYPYLLTTKRQAMLAWNLIELSKNKNIDEAHPKRLILVEQISALNKGQAIIIPNWVKEPTSMTQPGYYLRQDIIWQKNNPMPESVRDRCTKAHEYIFLLSKSEHYYFDQDAIKEKSTGRAAGNINISKAAQAYAAGNESHRTTSGLNAFAQKVREEGAENRNKRSVWTVATAPYAGAHFACVDEETECLTINGWKRHADLTTGVLAAQFDMATGLLSWAPIEDVARYPVVDQLMVAAKSRDVEMLLTPNHRTIIARRHNQTRKWQSLSIIRADEMKPSHAVPVSAAWQDSGDEPFSADWAELIGWYLAEGCESGASWSVEIYQSQAANPGKVARIRALLVSLGAEFLEAIAPRVWLGRDATMVAFQVRGFAAIMLRQWAPGKRFHPAVLTWSASLLDRLLIGLVDGDGHRRADGRFSFIQRDEKSASLAQAIGVRLGYSTMLSRRTGNTFTVYFTLKRLISFRGTGGEGAEIRQRLYTGVVWCPKLPASTWVARKNGRSFITGNTFPPALIEPCILAGSKPGDIVLDPFFGSGTTGEVALALGRQYIGCELNPEYEALQRERTRQQSLVLAA